MKVKLIINHQAKEFEEEINLFIKDVKIIDIKFSEAETNYSALILYN